MFEFGTVATPSAWRLGSTVHGARTNAHAHTSPTSHRTHTHTTQHTHAHLHTHPDNEGFVRNLCNEFWQVKDGVVRAIDENGNPLKDDD